MARQLEHFPNLVTMFLARSREKGERPFLWAKRAGAWTAISWKEAARQVASLADSLRGLGLEPGYIDEPLTHNPTVHFRIFRYPAAEPAADGGGGASPARRKISARVYFASDS